ncbi:baseplate wedge protein [Vibrio phage vB_VpaM_VPs20]|uniref:Baseplate wedge protein n=1 Tax=Vibrio phage vB_VpaM_VPs20 TaxID=2978980 RepID=A0A9X9JSM7_9CAUD|nr:baseplate wedge protein [Vibrio phage vB_VpaM_VPs20]UYD72131.1 baseplate wedge protein [Vibrio phage vB_VpaM_VPs20]
MAGITELGFTPKSYEDIVSDLESRMKQEFGESFDTTPESPDGMLLRIMAKFMHDQWLLAEAAYHAYNPSAVVGVGLDNLVRLNGISRIVDQPTTVAVQLAYVNPINDGETVPAGTIIESNGTQFVLNTDTILNGETLATCMILGPVVVNENETWSVVSDLGFDITVTNSEPGVTGITRETDPQLRARRERSVIRSGTSTAEAIYAAVADLNLEFITIIENSTDTTDPVTGQPPHSFMTVVVGSTEALVAQRIYENKPIGIQAYGDIVVPVEDSQGYIHNIGLSRPTEVPIEIQINVVRPSNVALSSVPNIQTAVIDHINSIQIGEDVIWAEVFSPATGASDAIVKSITIAKQGETLGTQDIELEAFQRAVADETTVTVTEI